MFWLFFEHIREKMEEDPYLNEDLDLHMNAINNYVFFQLKKEFFASKIPSKKEYELYIKMQEIQWVEPT